MRTSSITHARRPTSVRLDRRWTRRRKPLTFSSFLVSLALVIAPIPGARAASTNDPLGAPYDRRDAGDGPSNSPAIQRTEVCFAVHVLGDPATHQVSGTLFHRASYQGGGTALLLQHGSVSERSVWNPQITGAPSMADQLARAGFAVFTIDRLGYARSPYRTGEPGTGWALTMDSYVEMTHEMVTQIREGNYRIANDTCDGGTPARWAASKVVLVGHSGGAGLTEYYATRHHDIDGIVPLTWSNQGAGDTFLQYYLDTVPPQFAQGKDYVHLFSVGADGYSQPCQDFLFHLDGASDQIIEEICGPGYFGGDEPRLMPSGDLASQPYIMQRVQHTIGYVGPTPALLGFADRDFIFTGPDFAGSEPDLITPEIQMWTNECNCEVEVLWQQNAGHSNMFHDTAPKMTRGIIDWLRRHGL